MLWDTLAAGIETAEDELRLGISEIGCGAVPDRRLLHIRRRALAEIVHSREAQHGRRMTMACGLAKTGFGGKKILRQTLASEIEQPEIVAGPGIPLVGGLSEEARSGLRIPVDPLSRRIHQRERQLA